MATWSETIVIPRKNVSVSFVPYTSASSYSWNSADGTSLTGSAFACRFDAGDGKYSKISVNFISRFYAQEVNAYLYDSYDNLPHKESDIPTSSYVATTRITDIPGSSEQITISFENVNKEFPSYAYIILKPTSNSSKEVSFYDAAVETVVDDTPPLANPELPESQSQEKNYQGITFQFGVYNPSGMTLDGGQIQCSYNQNDWSNPIVNKDAIKYNDSTYQATVGAGTFNPGTVYWRCRAKTAYSDWGSWSNVSSFTAVERTPIIQNYKLNGGIDIYQDRTSPIVLTWQQSTSGITVTHSDIQYALSSDYDTWINIGTVQGDSTTYTIPANTFPAIAGTSTSKPYGGIKLRVIAYNINGIASNDRNYFAFVTADSAINLVNILSPRMGSAIDETSPSNFIFQTYNNITQMPPSDADMRWKTEGGEWQYLNHLADSLTPSTSSGYPIKNTVVIPANTFPPAVIYCQVRAYNQDGLASDWSSQAYFTTVDKPQISTALTPSSTIEDADEPITFTWATSSQSGEASRGADLQYSRDNATWINLGPSVESGPQIPGNIHEYEAPGHTIPPGSIFWRVRSYNRNMVAGDWSTAVSFVARAAPTVQDIQATAKPWATVIWQADDQQTYEIFVDGESLGSYFGTEKQFPLPDYLEDGVHTVGVRVMGSFSLWSVVAETNITIANAQAAALMLTTETNIDTALTWEGGDADFFIYRDGLMIAHTNEHSFTDRVALGTHEYQVIERLASGDYNASETITQTPAVPYQHIAALAGGDWIAIPHTLKSQSEPSYQESQETAFNYLSGNDYPIASIGSHRTDIGQYSAVFLYTEEAENRAFLALRGKPVILKTADGEVMIGVLNAWERRPKSTREAKLYTAYTFNIQRIGWEDFIDDTL